MSALISEIETENRRTSTTRKLVQELFRRRQRGRELALSLQQLHETTKILKYVKGRAESNLAKSKPVKQNATGFRQLSAPTPTPYETLFPTTPDRYTTKGHSPLFLADEDIIRLNVPNSQPHTFSLSIPGCGDGWELSTNDEFEYSNQLVPLNLVLKTITSDKKARTQLAIQVVRFALALPPNGRLWGLDDIYFPQFNGTDIQPVTTDAARPIIRCDTKDAQRNDVASSAGLGVIGIVLAEIWFGVQYKDFRRIKNTYDSHLLGYEHFEDMFSQGVDELYFDAVKCYIYPWASQDKGNLAGKKTLKLVLDDLVKYSNEL
ncbi:Protein of unknown function [Pyronema omphalodes CBS 100304]|uniref:Uncharacterized protein n=1 Tax=Pyronema omphalodes (strain CBS 100304) TaxID=1076935 RepID=U4L664_PYROM|nr:Protein of unknown function [Pyronema omphalodes CBS 100304]